MYLVLWFQVVLPPHLERIREKLAENIHELWVMNKIDLGWTYGAVSTHVHAHTSTQRSHVHTNDARVSCLFSRTASNG